MTTAITGTNTAATTITQRRRALIRLRPVRKVGRDRLSSRIRLNLGNASDITIWLYARDHDFLHVSKDADFVELTMLRGFPPKVLWLRIGNCVTHDIKLLIRANQAAIEDLSNDPERGVLALFKRHASN